MTYNSTRYSNVNLYNFDNYNFGLIHKQKFIFLINLTTDNIINIPIGYKKIDGTYICFYIVCYANKALTIYNCIEIMLELFNELNNNIEKMFSYIKETSFNYKDGKEYLVIIDEKYDEVNKQLAIFLRFFKNNKTENSIILKNYILTIYSSICSNICILRNKIKFKND